MPGDWEKILVEGLSFVLWSVLVTGCGILLVAILAATFL